MRLEIEINPDVKETLVRVIAQAMNRDVEFISQVINSETMSHITGFRQDEVVLLEADEISRFYSFDKKVFVVTRNQKEYTVRLRLYELEERLKGTEFVRISNSEIVNLKDVRQLDLSYKGTIGIEMKSGETSYVSRRYLSNIKKALGL